LGEKETAHARRRLNRQRKALARGPKGGAGRGRESVRVATGSGAEPGCGSGSGRRSGMTTGPHLSATQGGGRRVGCDGPLGCKTRKASWAARERKRAGPPGEKLGCAEGLGQKRRSKKEGKEILFAISKRAHKT
jgi:hypothetical protein